MSGEATTKQSLTSDNYLHLLGVCQWVFNSNCGFVIEMIDSEHHGNSGESWYELANMTAGRLKDHKKLVLSILSQDIYDCFSDLIDQRNAIMHSLPTGKIVDGHPIAIYKDRDNKQIDIDEQFLRDFIGQNEALSARIHSRRGY